MDRDRLQMDSKVVRSNEQVTGTSEGESVVLSTRTWSYYSFNSEGDQIWTLLATPQPLSQICDTILLHHEIDRQQCEQDVLSFVEGLIRDGLAQIVT